MYLLYAVNTEYMPGYCWNLVRPLLVSSLAARSRPTVVADRGGPSDSDKEYFPCSKHTISGKYRVFVSTD